MSVLTELRERCQGLSAGAVVDKALRAFGKEITISFSGAEDVLLIEYASQTGLPFSVMSLDTGRLHPETYRFFEKVESHYGIHIDYMFPRSDIVQALVREKGMFSFRTDGHTECCQIRKVEPLRRQLSTVRAWITGQRRDQSPTTRASLDVVELDTAFQGKDDGDLVKINPLVGMSSDEVWNAIRAFDVPHNELHERGFVSIGCEPCTRPILPGQHEREGRWWWENEDHKECGLHIKPGGS